MSSVLNVPSKKLYLLFYEVVEDYTQRRQAYREEHLAMAKQFASRGELLLGGALADPVDGALLLFRGNGPEVAESFANNDPYVKNGLVTRWYVRAWTVVAGTQMTVD